MGCVAFFGAIGIVTVYFALVVDQGHPLVTAILIGAIQLAWIPYITGMTGTGRTAVKFGETGAQGFLPFDDVSQGDVSFSAAMGILSILGHGLAYIGSLSFMAFSLFAYQVGSMTDRSSTYFKSRMPLYNFALLIEGFVQLSMGAYIIANFESGPLSAPVTIPMYTIFWPQLSIFVGLVQLITGMYGMVRSFSISPTCPKDYSFQAMCMFTWVCMITIQLTVQISWAPGGEMAANLPSLACVTFPLTFMPAFLDHMARNTPDKIDGNYYGIGEASAVVSKSLDNNEGDPSEEEDDENEEEYAAAAISVEEGQGATTKSMDA